MKRFEVKAMHEVEVTYSVEAKDEDDAIARLCNIELFRSYQSHMGFPRDAKIRFGPDDYVMKERGIEIADFECYHDPSPTGRRRIEREWEIQVAEKEE